jgi:quinol monooxygenase YgiN
MLCISQSNSGIAVINVFTVAPEDQQRLVDLLTRATQRSVAHVPGFVAAALHRSLDGRKVTMYAQWQSIEDYERMRGRPDASPFLAEALKIATFGPGQRASIVRVRIARQQVRAPFLPRRPNCWRSTGYVAANHHSWTLGQSCFGTLK